MVRRLQSNWLRLVSVLPMATDQEEKEVAMSLTPVQQRRADQIMKVDQLT